MEFITKHWLLIVGVFLAWRWKVAEDSGVPLEYSLRNFTRLTSADLKTQWQAEHPAIVIPLPGSTVVIDGTGVSVL